MAFDTEPIFISNFRFEKVFAGTKTLAWILPQPLVFTTQSFLPGHVMQMQSPDGSSEMTSLKRQLLFGGGGAMDPAELTIIIDGTRFVAGTQTHVELPMIVNSAKDIIYIQTEVQDGDDEDDIAADLRAALAAANNGDAIPANSRRWTRNGATIDQIQAAMENYFGTDEAAAFVVTNNQIVLTAGANGADGNNQQCRTAVYASLPDPLPTFGNGQQPIIEGIGAATALGPIRAVQASAVPQTLVIQTDSLVSQFGTKLVGVDGTGQMTFVQGRDQDLKAFLAGQAEFFSDNYHFVSPGAQSSLAQYCLIFTHDNAEVPGQIDYKIIPRAVFTGGLVQDLTKAADNGLPASFGIIGDESGTPIIIDAFFRGMQAA